MALASVHFAGPTLALIVLAAILLLRLVLPSHPAVPGDFVAPTAAVLAVVLFLGWVAPATGVRAYPVLMNSAMIYVFGRTLIHPPSMIERFARIVEPELDDFGVRYTRTVTLVWVCFFAVNGCIALLTAVFGSWTVWGIYNGVISYCLVGILFAGEYLIRRRLRTRRNVQT